MQIILIIFWTIIVERDILLNYEYRIFIALYYTKCLRKTGYQNFTLIFHEQKLIVIYYRIWTSTVRISRAKRLSLSNKCGRYSAEVSKSCRPYRVKHLVQREESTLWFQILSSLNNSRIKPRLSPSMDIADL